MQAVHTYSKGLSTNSIQTTVYLSSKKTIINTLRKSFSLKQHFIHFSPTIPTPIKRKLPTSLIFLQENIFLPNTSPMNCGMNISPRISIIYSAQLMPFRVIYAVPNFISELLQNSLLPIPKTHVQDIFCKPKIWTYFSVNNKIKKLLSPRKAVFL